MIEDTTWLELMLVRYTRSTSQDVQCNACYHAIIYNGPFFRIIWIRRKTP